MSEELIMSELKGITNLINEKFDNNNKDHKLICEKQDHTNGDVVSLKLWRSAIVGGLTVITVIVTIFGVYFVNQMIGFGDKLDKKIQQQISNMEFEKISK